jgi:hypothetical protein
LVQTSPFAVRNIVMARSVGGLLGIELRGLPDWPLRKRV